MVETAVAIIASCLPALRSMFLGGNTQNATSSYGKHYELTSDRRKAHGTPLGTHNTSALQSRKAHHTPHDSEDSLVTGGLSVEIPSAAHSFSHEKRGINVETTIAMHYGEEQNRHVLRSPV